MSLYSYLHFDPDVSTIKLKLKLFSHLNSLTYHMRFQSIRFPGIVEVVGVVRGDGKFSRHDVGVVETSTKQMEEMEKSGMIVWEREKERLSHWPPYVAGLPRRLSLDCRSSKPEI